MRTFGKKKKKRDLDFSPVRDGGRKGVKEKEIRKITLVVWGMV